MSVVPTTDCPLHPPPEGVGGPVLAPVWAHRHVTTVHVCRFRLVAQAELESRTILTSDLCRLIDDMRTIDPKWEDRMAENDGGGNPQRPSVSTASVSHAECR